jgi:hypothetical protein
MHKNTRPFLHPPDAIFASKKLESIVLTPTKYVRKKRKFHGAAAPGDRSAGPLS